MLVERSQLVKPTVSLLPDEHYADGCVEVSLRYAKKKRRRQLAKIWNKSGLGCVKRLCIVRIQDRLNVVLEHSSTECYALAMAQPIAPSSSSGGNCDISGSDVV